MNNKKLYLDKDFESIYWHDSILNTIIFDQTEFCDFNLLIDFVLESHPPKNPQNENDYVLIMQPAIVKFLFATDVKINLKWEDVIINPTFAFIERKKAEFKDKIKNKSFYKYIIEFNGSNEGNIVLDNVPNFEMQLFGDPILYISSEDYIEKRNKILKDNFDLIWKNRAHLHASGSLSI